MRVALYVRVSTERQADEGLSIDAQTSQLKAWANQSGHQVIRVYEELGESARDDKRPAFRQMIDDATSPEHPFDAIIVLKFARFFRKVRGFCKYEELLDRVHVSILSVLEPTDGAAGKFMRHIYNSFDEYESDVNSQRVSDCMKENARHGYFNGSRTPFGYESIATEQRARGKSGYKRKLAIKTVEAETVRRIFELALNGEQGVPFGVKRIATFLNENGITYRGGLWSANRIHDRLVDTAYIGEYVFNKRTSDGKRKDSGEWITVAVPAIIDRSTFEKVRAQLSGRAPQLREFKGISSPALLTSIAKCQCGAGLVRDNGKRNTYHYYVCATKKTKGARLCSLPRVPMKWLNTAVLGAMIESCV